MRLHWPICHMGMDDLFTNFAAFTKPDMLGWVLVPMQSILASVLQRSSKVKVCLSVCLSVRLSTCNKM